jgi:phospho-N-acetylmuramoyl-pentapeptide-transferase
VLYDLARPFADKYVLANLLRYQTFRTGGAIMTALLVCFSCSARRLSVG